MLRKTVLPLCPIVLLLAWGAWLPALNPVRAQSQPELRALQISLWPEYDRPSMLVIYRMTLSPETALPANLVFRIPPGAEPLVVAVGASPETVDEVSFTQNVTGDWKELAFTASFPAIQLEYYDPALRIEDQARHFEYRWPGDYAVEGLTIEVQQPLGATEMRITPDLGPGKQKASDQKILYYTSQVGSVGAGQDFEITVDYKKSTRALTVEQMEVEPSQPIGENTIGRVRLRDILIGALVVGALALLGIALVMGGGIRLKRAGPIEARPERRRRSREAQTTAAEAAPGGSVYCHQCGRRSIPGDRYCRSCGARLRHE